MEEQCCLVSVLCTAFNHEKYIRNTLDSFISQRTDFAFEVLVSDDFSTDGTADIIREYEAKYPSIIRPFYLKENLYSQMIDIYPKMLYPNARGKYIAFCEGDDYWTDPDKLQLQVDFLEAHPNYSACVHNTVLHYCAGNAADRPLLRRGGDGDVPFEAVARGVSYSFHTSSVLAVKALLVDIPDYYLVGWSYGFTDHSTALQLMFKGPVWYIDRCMSVYRINSGQSWSDGVDHQFRKLRKYVEGEAKVLEAALPHAPETYRPVLQNEIMERNFELMYIEGRDREQRKPPYDKMLRQRPFKYRAANLIKSLFPAAYKLYRKIKGYV